VQRREFLNPFAAQAEDHHKVKRGEELLAMHQGQEIQADQKEDLKTGILAIEVRADHLLRIATRVAEIAAMDTVPVSFPAMRGHQEVMVRAAIGIASLAEMIHVRVHDQNVARDQVDLAKNRPGNEIGMESVRRAVRQIVVEAVHLVKDRRIGTDRPGNEIGMESVRHVVRRIVVEVVHLVKDRRIGTDRPGNETGMESVRHVVRRIVVEVVHLVKVRRIGTDRPGNEIGMESVRHVARQIVVEVVHLAKDRRIGTDRPGNEIGMESVRRGAHRGNHVKVLQIVKSDPMIPKRSATRVKMLLNKDQPKAGKLAKGRGGESFPLKLVQVNLVRKDVLVDPTVAEKRKVVRENGILVIANPVASRRRPHRRLGLNP